MMQRVTDLITTEDIASWTPDKPVVISAGTGTGKSYFVKNALYDYARNRGQKILMLINRKLCKQQFEYELFRDGKDRVIDIATYQKIDTASLYKRNPALERYSFIVLDEWHYFSADSKFNRFTDLSFDAIFNSTKPIKIAMSATCSDMVAFIERETDLKPIKYEIPHDYTYVDKLSFYYLDELLPGLIKEVLAKGEKAIIFIQSAQKAYKLYEQFSEHAIFACSEENQTYSKYRDEQCIREMIAQERFEAPLLICTTCLDNGFNIVDPDVKHIFVDNDDVHSLIQCLGRKRTQGEDDKVNFYVKAITNKKLGSKKGRLVIQIKMANYLRDYGTTEWLKEYPRKTDVTEIIYDDIDENGALVKRINKLMLWQKQREIDLITLMLGLGDYGFCKYMAQYLGKYDQTTGRYTYKVITDTDDLNKYLAELVGKPMLRLTDRQELIKRMDVRQNGRILNSRGVLNKTLEERELPYRINQYNTSRMINGKKKNFKSVWEVVPHDWRIE